MICLNELSALKCNKQTQRHGAVNHPVGKPFAPHISEELWHRLGHDTRPSTTPTGPHTTKEYLKEDSVTYAISFNGKVRFNWNFLQTCHARM